MSRFVICGRRRRRHTDVAAVFVFSHPDSNDENGNDENGNSVKGKRVADFEILKLWNQVGLIVEHVNR